MQIAKLPPLSEGIYKPILDALVMALGDMRGSRVYQFEFEVLDTEFSPNPYLQVRVDDKGRLVAEIVSNYFLKPKISKWNVAQIRILGFRDPTDFCPNFWRVIESKDNLLVLAKSIVEVFRVAYGFSKDSKFTFGDDSYASSLARRANLAINHENSSILMLPSNVKVTTQSQT